MYVLVLVEMCFSREVIKFYVLEGLYFVVPIQLSDTVTILLGSADLYVCS